MPDSRVTTITPGVTRQNCGWCELLYGKIERLVATGLVKQSWFADGNQRDERGRVVRSKHLTIDGRHIKTTVLARGMCYVWIPYTPAEAEANRVEQPPELPKPEEKPGVPGTISEYREKLLVRVTDVERFAQSFLDDQESFYHLSSADAQNLAEVLSHLRSVIEHARIRPRKFAVIEGGLGLATPESTL